MRSLDELLEEAEAIDATSEWGAGFLPDRCISEPLPWDWASIVRGHLEGAGSLLDQGTGNGAWLAGMAPLPPMTVATEGWMPTLRAASTNLRPLGVHVVAASDSEDNIVQTASSAMTQPFKDRSFDVIHNRHTSYLPHEVARLLAPDGVFVTQQVGGWNGVDLNKRLGNQQAAPTEWNLDFAVEQLERAGFVVERGDEARPTTTFTDVAAVAGYIKTVPWEVPGFSIEGYRERLAALHGRISREGALVVRDHYFWLTARRA